MYQRQQRQRQIFHHTLEQSWASGFLCRQAQLTPEPPVSVMPLGTGNGVARNLGWGKKINKKWISSPQAVAEVMGRTAVNQPCMERCLEVRGTWGMLPGRWLAGLSRAQVAHKVAGLLRNATMYCIRTGC